MFSLEELIRPLKRLGAGYYSDVYDMGDGTVVKVPAIEGVRHLPLHERLAVAKNVCRMTGILHQALGDIIVPVVPGPLGTILQPFQSGVFYIDLDHTQIKKRNRTLDAIIDLADNVAQKHGFSVDTSRSNFVFKNDFRTIRWFDPVTPE